jgi:AraC-like DNA-binding protein
MKNFSHLILLAALMLFVVSCNSEKREHKMPVAQDTIHTRSAALRYMGREPDRALQIIDSAEIVGNLSDWRADMLRAIVYSRTNEDMKYDSAIIIGERLMLHDSVQANTEIKEEVLEVLLNACRMKKDNEQAMHWALMLSDLYRSQGDETEALRTDAEIGTFLIRIGQQEEGLAKIDSVIHQLDGKRKFNELDASIIALKRKAEICNEIAHYDDMIPPAQRMLELLADYEDNPEVYLDNSIREPDDEERPRYIDFYRGKAYAYMAVANAALGNKKKAFEYIDLYNQTASSQIFVNRLMIAPTLGKLGEYDQMLEIYDEVERRIGSDTLNANYAEILHGRAEAAEARGQYRVSNNYWRRYAELKEILNDKLLQSKAHLFAARYHAQEQQREIEHHREATRRAWMMGIAVIIVSVLILLFTIFIVIDLRRTKTRNRILAFQISEASKYKEQYRRLTQTAQEASSADKYSDMSDAELYAYLRDVIEGDELYLNPNFERQTLINRTGLSKERIGAAFAQGSDNERLTTLIRELRLDYAVRLMSEKPELTVEQVCQASGFTRADTFTRNFKAKYGMTPTAYQQTLS